SPEPLTIAMHPVHKVALTAAPETPELNYVELEPDPPPLAETLFALAAPQSRDQQMAAPMEVAPLTAVMRAQLPLDSIRLNATPPRAALVQAGLRELPIEQLNAAPAPTADHLRALDMQGGAPQFALSTPPLRPRLQLASGRRYCVESREPVPAIATFSTASLPVKPVQMAMPDREVKVLRAAA